MKTNTVTTKFFSLILFSSFSNYIIMLGRVMRWLNIVSFIVSYLFVGLFECCFSSSMTQRFSFHASLTWISSILFLSLAFFSFSYSILKYFFSFFVIVVEVWTIKPQSVNVDTIKWIYSSLTNSKLIVRNWIGNTVWK